MGGQLAFNACFVAVDAAGRIACVRAWSAGDAFFVRWRIRMIIIETACAGAAADGTGPTSARDVAHDGDSTAR